MTRVVETDGGLVGLAMGGATKPDHYTEASVQKRGNPIQARDHALAAMAAALSETLNRCYDAMGFPDSGGY